MKKFFILLRQRLWCCKKRLWWNGGWTRLGFIISVPVSLHQGYGDSLYNFSTLHKGSTLMEHNTEKQLINNRWMQHTANINYTHVFSSALDRELTVNIDYNRNNSLANTGSRTTFLPILLPAYTRQIAQKSSNRKLVGAWLALTAQIGAGHEITKSYDGLMNLRHWMVDISAELNAYLPKEWTLSIDGMYTTPSVWGMERMSAWAEINLALKKDFPKLGLTLTARVNDLLLSS